MGSLEMKLAGLALSIFFVFADFGAGYAWRWHGEAAREQARIVKEQMDAAEDRRIRNLAADKGVQVTHEEKVKTQIVFQQINTELKEIVTREIYRNVCIDDDGLRLWNDAAEGVRHVGVQPSGVDRSVPAKPPAP